MLFHGTVYTKLWYPLALRLFLPVLLRVVAYILMHLNASVELDRKQSVSKCRFVYCTVLF